MSDWVEAKNLEKNYGQAQALRGVSLALKKGEQYVILGASGSGKSTLLYLLGGLERPDGGQIFVGGQNLGDLSDEKLAAFRNQDVGFIFQFHFLLSSMNCLDNILLPSRIRGTPPEGLGQKVEDLAQQLGVGPCLKKYPYQLSGGEQQRVNIIRALWANPGLLLCDEPTGNLDSENSLRVIALLRRLAREYHSTLVIVTHDLEIAEGFSHKILMKDGKIESLKAPEEKSPQKTEDLIERAGKILRETDKLVGGEGA